jgi:hypothetical protein
LAALKTKQETEKKVGEHVVASVARVMSKGLKKLTEQFTKNNCAMVVVNQFRDKIDASGYGDKQETGGGRGLKYYASIRYALKSIKRLSVTNTIKTIDGKSKAVYRAEGIRVQLKTIKNKVFRPFLDCEFIIYFDGRGIHWEEGFIDFLLKYRVVRGVKGKSDTFEFHPLCKDFELFEIGQFTKEDFFNFMNQPSIVKELEKMAIHVLFANEIDVKNTKLEDTEEVVEEPIKEEV